MSPAFVLDCSVAAAWALQESAAPRAAMLLERLAGASVLVPPLWHLEIRNVLLLAIRRKRIAPDTAETLVARLESLPVETDRAADAASLSRAWAMARARQLTIYDAVYLELAARMQLPLATLDQGLARSAAGEGVAIL